MAGPWNNKSNPSGPLHYKLPSDNLNITSYQGQNFDTANYLGQDLNITNYQGQDLDN